MPGFNRIPMGALQWIRETMSPAFASQSEKAIKMAKDTGNEHAVVQGYRNWVSPIATGDRSSVQPIFPQHKTYKFPLTGDIQARMHTHPVDDWSAITVAPSDADLSMWAKNTRGQPIRDIIVSPDKNTYVDYSRSDHFDFQAPDKLYFELMKHTNGNLGGVEPVKPDVYFSWLRKQAENRNSGTQMNYQLGDEAPYADELYQTLKRLGLKKGGLVQMKEQGYGR